MVWSHFTLKHPVANISEFGEALQKVQNFFIYLKKAFMCFDRIIVSVSKVKSKTVWFKMHNKCEKQFTFKTFFKWLKFAKLIWNFSIRMQFFKFN